MDGKKGVISLQLNWIFVLIIGAIILLFFVVIVQKQKTYSEETISGTVQTDLQAIFSSAYVSTGTSSIIEVPNQEIKYGCEGFKVGNQFPAHYPYAFAPNLIKSPRNTISVFSYDWSVPYKVTNFLYVTSPDVRYILDNTAYPDLRDALDALLPPRYITQEGESKLFMNKLQETPTNDKNNYKVRVISFGLITTADLDGFRAEFTNTNPRDISALSINPDGSCVSDAEKQLNCFGTLTFWNLENGVWNDTTSYYVGRASVLAAVFSENAEIYKCGMKNAFDRLKSITGIYKKRTNKFIQDIPSCAHLYTYALDNLDQIFANSDPNSPASYTSIYQQAYGNSFGNLDYKNDIILANSCPAVY